MHSVFRNRAFARLFAGRLITNAGDSVYTVAAMWLAFELGGSSFYAGLAGFLTMLPQTLQFLVGPFVDRWQLRRILVATQVAQGILVLSIPLAAATGRLSVWVVLVVMPVVSLLNQFVYPAQQAALPRIVEKEELVEANSAFSFAYQGVDFVFTALGGVLVALVGAVSLYLIDSVTFATAALVFLTVRVPPAEKPDGGDESVTSAVDDYLTRLREGVRYVRGSVLVWLLAASLVVNCTVGIMMSVLPAYANANGGPDAYGFMLAAVVGGLLVGSLAATPLKRFSLAGLSVAGFAFGGVVWLAAVAVGWFPATVGLFFVAWIPVGATNVIFAAMIQSVVSEDFMGRVASVNASASAGAMPIGALLGGVAGDAVGSGVVVTSAGFGFIFLSLYWLAHPLLRGLSAVEDIEGERYGLARPTRAESSESF
ncbi:MFS transporter [Haladaptatus halobius]|uniref:MFS transporter n=1 Tax=Haladaptatus halobius TaxID=2884875 RepID=UPI001D0A0DA2|nr:MFS transporter [Haladaptatus halobius]